MVACSTRSLGTRLWCMASSLACSLVQGRIIARTSLACADIVPRRAHSPSRTLPMGIGSRGADDAYWSLGRNCTGAGGRALACGDAGVVTGLRVAVAVAEAVGCGASADVLGRGLCSGVRLCSGVLAIDRVNWSWLALRTSATFALSRDACSWFALI